jgi:hypothetical protein
MFNKKPSIYIARAMSGVDQAEVVKQAKEDKEFFESCGIMVLCPVAKEKVKAIHKPIVSDQKHMNLYWPADKRMIRECNVLVNMSPHLPSLGAIREFGYARYHLWKKVISVFPEGKVPMAGAVCYFEDDAVVDSRIMAAESILRTHGTYVKRLIWRLKMYKRSWLKAKWYRMLEFLR